jgi:4-hydroxythreonine-4-phosphate dehydrogenase
MTLQAPVALTLGEPAGIGPDLAAMAWEKLEGRVPFFVLGDPDHLRHLGVPVVPIATPSETLRALPRGLPVLPHAFPAPATPGRLQPENAAAVISAITRAVDLTMRGEASALTTGPIHKKALMDGAGFAFPGHTEFLAHLAGVDRVVMMLAGPGLRVVPTTIHIPLSEVPQALDRALLSDTIRITHAALRRDFGIESPRIAVTGLNPHAGEGGAMGREEIEVIAPVLEALRAEGYGLTGPHSADTLFHAEARARYDAAVAMYHDQALIPLKTLAFDAGVNVTLGLPFVRTSPDHGTALDIAGTGRARPDSLIAALELAADLARRRPPP